MGFSKGIWESTVMMATRSTMMGVVSGVSSNVVMGWWGLMKAVMMGIVGRVMAVTPNVRLNAVVME